MTEGTSNLLEWALHYLELGLCVIPLHSINSEGHCTCKKGKDCDSPGKHPRISWKEFMNRLPTEAEVRAWWERWPSANIGITTGALSGWILLDIDGEQGINTLREKKLAVCPDAPHVSTGGGGYHYLFEWPGFPVQNFSGKIGHTILPKIDFRGDGGLFVAPPSTHVSGKKYEWIKGLEDGKRVPAPEWLLNLIKGQHSESGKGGGKKGKPQGKMPAGSAPEVENSDWVNELLLGVDEGGRNASCTRLAGWYLRKLRGDKNTVLTILEGWDSRNRPPMGREAIEKVVNSIANRQAKDELGEILNITVLRVVFNMSPEKNGTYDFYFEIKGVTIKCEFTPDELFSQSKFQNKVAAIGPIVLPTMKKEEWKKTLQNLFNEAEISTVEFDTTQMSWVVEVIKRKMDKSKNLLSSVSNSLVILNGEICLTTFWLLECIANYAQKMSTKEVVKAIRDIGFEKCSTRDENGKQHRYWKLAVDKFTSDFLS